LRYVGGPRGGRKVTIRLFAPYRHRRHWACDVDIQGLLDPIQLHVHGGDSMQALMIAVQGITLKIKSEAPLLAWDVGSEVGPSGEIGIPFAMLFPSSIGSSSALDTTRLQRDVEHAIALYERRIEGQNQRFFQRLSRESAAPFERIDHVQLAMPPGEEARARSFYVNVLGMVELAKPEELKSRGGVWFESDGVQLHLGVEKDFTPAKKAHPALRCSDFQGLLQKLRDAGIPVASEATPLSDGSDHAYIDDPFGNRIELIGGL
jgi:catechol 2,3-dioxygenase-like lactoylglutathione lyase family enzyme